MRVVIDTNIIVSGLLFGGLPLKVIKAGLSSQFVWVISSSLIEELERVLSSKKFDISLGEMKALTTPIYDVCEVVVPTIRINAIKRCPADNRVLECAVDGDCDFIVTGDRRDLLSIENFHGVSIITARQLCEKL